MRKITIILSLTFLIGFLLSCDPGLDHKKIIQNNSDFDLHLLIENTGWETNYLVFDSITFDSIKMIVNISVPSKTHKVIFDYSEIGDVNDIDNCGIECDYIGFDTTNYIFNKNVMDLNNWVKRIEEEYNSGAGTVNCYFQISNENIEIK